MSSPPIKNGVYIARKNGKEQVVSISRPPSNGLYECDYGVVSSHETFCTDAQLRELTPAERDLLKTNHICSLPQQFYQSGPPGMPSMDAWKLEKATHCERPPGKTEHRGMIISTGTSSNGKSKLLPSHVANALIASSHASAHNARQASGSTPHSASSNTS